MLIGSVICDAQQGVGRTNLVRRLAALFAFWPRITGFNSFLTISAWLMAALVHLHQ